MLVGELTPEESEDLPRVNARKTESDGFTINIINVDKVGWHPGPSVTMLSARVK